MRTAGAGRTVGASAYSRDGHQHLFPFPTASSNRCLSCNEGVEDLLLDDDVTDDQLDQVLMAEMTEV